MGLENPPDQQFQIPKAQYEDAKRFLAAGMERRIYAFQTPDDKIAFRMTAKEIIESVEKGAMTVI